MANTNLVPSAFKTHLASKLVSSLTDQPNTVYYMFIGNHMPNANNPVAPDDIIFEMDASYRNMIAGKRVTVNDVRLMIENRPYEANVYMAMWDDRDTLLFTKNYYTVVNAGSYSHVWKVLDNNNDSPSTIQPDFSQLGISDTSYRTSDGYLWKYMFSVDSTTVAKFATTRFFPIVANTTVETNAKFGSLEVIKVDYAGSGYKNWYLGTFAGSDIRVGGNTILYSISSDPFEDGLFTGCNIYISGGVGSGQYRTITNSFSNANGNFIVIDSDFTIVPRNSSTYQIYPSVKIFGTGQSINADARAIVNAVGNTISHIDILSQGLDYAYAEANVVANAVVGAVEANIRPILSPYQGHGSDPATELNATRVAFSVMFANNEANTIPAENQFRQIGVIKDPLFSNVTINFSSSTTSNFGINELVYSMESRHLGSDITTSFSSNTITSSDTDFTKSLKVNDWIFLSSTTDISQKIIAQVYAINSAHTATLKRAVPWTASNNSIDFAELVQGGRVTKINSANSIVIDRTSVNITNGASLIGLQSGAYGVISTIERSGVVKNFDTFVGLSRIEIADILGTFQTNEFVYTGNSFSTASGKALLHSILNNNVMYTSNTIGSFAVSTQIKGERSGATATITKVCGPEIIFNSGKILYLENIVGVNRTNDESQQINLIFELGK